MRSYFSPDIIVAGSSFDLNLCPTLLTLTTRDPSVAVRRSRSSIVRAKWPRWLTPICHSVYITPALLISRSMRSWRARSSAAAVRTESSDARSSDCTCTVASGCASTTRARAASPLSRLRTAITTSAPAPASASAVSRPRPVLAPVITATPPVWSGMWAVLQGLVVILLGSHVMVEIERVRRPFWAHQLIEYLLGIALISVSVQMPQPALPALLGLLILVNAAVAKGAAGAFRLAGKRAHRLLDVVVMLLLLAGTVQPWISIDNVGRLLLGGIAFVLWFVWFHTDFTEQTPRAERTSTTTDAGRPTSEDIGRGAGRMVGGGDNSLKRWKDSFNSGSGGDD